MGLDGSRLTVPDALRSWHAAGWRYCFQERSGPCADAPADEPACWPQPWCDYATRITPGASLFLTSFELGADMAGQGDASRRNFWRTCIAALQCAKGTVAFWPMSEFRDGALVPNPGMFHRAMAYFRPKVAACFGSEVFFLLTGLEFVEGKSHFLDDTTYLAIPSPEDITAKGEKRLRDIAHMLRFHLTRQ